MKIICSYGTFEATADELKKSGYIWAEGGSVTLADLRKVTPRADYFIIDCFYNPITKRNEMQYNTEYFYKKEKRI